MDFTVSLTFVQTIFAIFPIINTINRKEWVIIELFRYCMHYLFFVYNMSLIGVDIILVHFTCFKALHFVPRPVARPVLKEQLLGTWYLYWCK